MSSIEQWTKPLTKNSDVQGKIIQRSRLTVKFHYSKFIFMNDLCIQFMLIRRKNVDHAPPHLDNVDAPQTERVLRV